MKNYKNKLQRDIKKFKVLMPICLIFGFVFLVVGVGFIFYGYYGEAVMEFAFVGLCVVNYFACKERIKVSKQELFEI